MKQKLNAPSATPPAPNAITFGGKTKLLLTAPPTVPWLEKTRSLTKPAAQRLRGRAANATQLLPGKLGEWVQGVDESGQPFLYTCTVTSGPYAALCSARWARRCNVVTPGQPGKPVAKTRRAVTQFLDEWGWHLLPGIEIAILNSPPVAKGLGSSSVDTAGAMLAVADLLKVRILPEQMYRIQCGLERSDFLFAPDKLVRANPVTGEFALVGNAPKAVLIGWDTAPAGRVETATAASLDKGRRAYAGEYAVLSACLESGEPEGILYACTRSAEVSNALLPKPGFAWALAETRQHHNVGLVSAHSGTYLAFAVLTPADPELIGELARRVKEHGGVPQLFQTGGPQ
jgi:L-threonine kinase